MRIATVQMQMKWRSKANVETILTTNRYVAQLGIDVAIYPELAITGYHREIRREIQATLDNPTFLEDIAASAGENELVVWVGAPVEMNGKRYNSYQCYGASGDLVGEIYKNGITTNEEIIFSHGKDRPIFHLGSWQASAFLCRESVDLSILEAQFGSEPPELLFWPGFIGNQSPLDPDNPDGTPEQAIAIAKSLSTYVVQCNWANSLNSPTQKDLGGSIVIGRDGSIIGRCPDAEPGIGVVNLETQEFLWDATYF